MGQSHLSKQSNVKDQVDPDRNTLKVYWYLLLQPSSTAGIRQIQRAMGFASPNAAIFHLEKLSEMQLVQKTPNGEYYIKRRKRFGVMKSFFLIYRRNIPKIALYAIGMTCAMIGSTIWLLPVFSPYVLIALLPGCISTVIFWFEAYLVWQRRPRFRT